MLSYARKTLGPRRRHTEPAQPENEGNPQLPTPGNQSQQFTHLDQSLTAFAWLSNQVDHRLIHSSYIGGQGGQTQAHEELSGTEG